MRNLIPLTVLFFLNTSASLAQLSAQWPKSISSSGYSIKIYQPQVEYYEGDSVRCRGAFSILGNGKTDPVFGALWTESTLQTDRANRTAFLDQVKVLDIKFAGDSNAAEVSKLKSILEKEIPLWDMVLSLDQLLTSMEEDGNSKTNSAVNLSTSPPKIIYTTKPSSLVLIDGDPKLEMNKEMGVDMVLNSAFTIAQAGNLFYLYGSNKWFSSKSITGPWKYEKSVPKALDKLNMAIKENEKKEDKATMDSASKSFPEIIVSTEPAELIQSNGDADFLPIQGTSLLYMTNTNNDVFMNIPDQQYYVLLSGRWYKSASLKGSWTYVASDQLPADFAKIPVNSAKDDVLSSVAGTEQARDAVMDAQIPQTAKVDRKTATAKVSYNGEPKFDAVQGTTLQYAVNTESTVLLSGKTYYCVENGIWFEAITPKGPWTVSDSRPTDVEKIPPTVPVYNVKYVYIYETTPQYVYVGYTPGYMGSYVYGATVIYGTGYYYNPWYGPYYYPRPVTYGFSMRYNPWYGWSVGFHYSAGWFNYSVYGSAYRGGYWGPPMYRPPYYRPPGYPPYYRPPYYPRPGYRPPVATPYYRGGNNNITINNNNIYRNNKGVTANDRVRPMPTTNPSTRPATGTGNGNNRLPSTQPTIQPSPANPNNRLPSTQPTTQPATRPSTGSPNNRLPSVQPANNNVMTDRQGNVFQKDGNNWQQRTGNGWQNVNQGRQGEIKQLNQQQQSINRGNTRTNNYNQSRQSAPQQRAAPASSAPRGGKR